MIGYADYGIVVSAALLLAGRWIARRSGDLNVMAAAIWAPLGVLAAVAINQPIVAALHMARPYVELPEILVDVLAGLTLGTAIGGAGFGAARPGLHWLLTRAERARLVRPLITAAQPIERASR